LRPEICGRVPIRLNRDNSYVDGKYKFMPKNGFTAMFSKMTQHPRIHVLLNTDFMDISRNIKPKKATVYSGPIDHYSNYTFGKLDYRSLKFDFSEFHQDYKQDCVQINYPNEFAYTRSVEIKHVTKQKHPHTVISYETPQPKGEPFYPVYDDNNLALLKKYEKLAEVETRQNRVFFCGRLAQYKYFNTDEVVAEALNKFEEIKKL